MNRNSPSEIFEALIPGLRKILEGTNDWHHLSFCTRLTDDQRLLMADLVFGPHKDMLQSHWPERPTEGKSEGTK
jgi:hypothetical protein